MSSKTDDEREQLLPTPKPDEAKPKEQAAPAPESKNQTLLLISFLAMIVIGLGNKIFQVRFFINERTYFDRNCKHYPCTIMRISFQYMLPSSTFL